MTACCAPTRAWRLPPRCGYGASWRAFGRHRARTPTSSWYWSTPAGGPLSYATRGPGSGLHGGCWPPRPSAELRRCLTRWAADARRQSDDRAMQMARPHGRRRPLPAGQICEALPGGVTGRIPGHGGTRSALCCRRCLAAALMTGWRRLSAPDSVDLRQWWRFGDESPWFTTDFLTGRHPAGAGAADQLAPAAAPRQNNGSVIGVEARGARLRARARPRPDAPPEPSAAFPRCRECVADHGGWRYQRAEADGVAAHRGGAGTLQRRRRRQSLILQPGGPASRRRRPTVHPRGRQAVLALRLCCWTQRPGGRDAGANHRSGARKRTKTSLCSVVTVAMTAKHHLRMN